MKSEFRIWRYSWLLLFISGMLSTQIAVAACSSWQGRAFLNEYYFGTSANYIELYSTDPAFQNSWQNWSIDVYTASGVKTTYPLTTATVGVSSCSQSGKTWVRTTIPAGLPSNNGLVTLTDNFGQPVDVFLFDKSVPTTIWTNNATNWAPAFAASCTSLASALTSQVGLGASNQSNLILWGTMGNKDYLRMSDGGLNGVGNPWYKSTSTGAGTTFSSCSSNNGNFTKIATTQSVLPGGTATFLLNFVGTGTPTAGTSVTVTDAVPLPLTNVTAVPSLNSGSATIGVPTVTATPITWTFPAPAAGVTSTLTVTAQVPASATAGTFYTNTAQTTTLTPTQSDIATVTVASPTSPSFIVAANNYSACINSPVNITVTAMSGPGGTGSQYAYTGTVTLIATSVQGTWAKVAGNGAFSAVAGSGLATYTFTAADNGKAVFSLTETTTQSTSASAIDAATGSPSGSSAPITFGAATLTDADVVTPTYAPVAGRPHKLAATDCGKGGAIASTLWYTPTANNPATAGAPQISTSVNCAGAITLGATMPGASNITLTYPATIYLCTSDVGQYAINLATAATSTAANFTVRPFSLVASAIKQGATLNPASNTAAGAVFAKAGSNFQATVGAYRWSSIADTNNDGIPDVAATLAQITAGGATPAYAWPTQLAAIAPFTPSGGTAVAGVLNNGALTFASGIATPTTLNYSEVGSFSLSVSAGNFLNSGLNLNALVFDNIPARNSVVGRFTPDHFDTVVTQVGGVPMACASGLICPATFNGMVYSGQPFTTNVYARNALGADTQNYDSVLGYAKAVTLSAVDAVGGAVSTVGTITAGATVPSASFKSGATLLGAPALPAFTFSAIPTAPTPIYLRATDTDTVSSLRAVPASSIEGGVEVVSGRIKMANAYGSELLPLSTQVTVQYYSGDMWSTNVVDSITSITLAATYNVIKNGVTTGTTTPSPTGTIVLSGGSKSIRLSKPTGGSGVATINPTAPVYLLVIQGEVIFGVYRGGRQFIYLREAY